jgi:serine phosphatase RsbU (regulator of sigma subunit)
MAVFLFSDGVTEAMDFRNNLFGEERIMESLNYKYSNEKTLYSDVKTFVRSKPLSDDLKIVMIESI